MEIEHVSISRARLYKECAYKYRFKYHLKISTSNEEQFHFKYGKFIHFLAETYVKEKAKRSLTEIASDTLKGRIEYEEGKPTLILPEDYLKRFPIHLANIKKLTDRIGTQGLVEHKFNFDLDPPNQKFVTGLIDRLIFNEKTNQVWIIDYKTTKKGKWRETKESIIYDKQLRCYAKVAQRMYKIPATNILCALYYLDDGELLAARYSEESLIGIEKELLAVYNEIENSDPEKVRGNVGDHCRMCDYRDICPFVNFKKTVAWDGDMSSL